jgi:hypothetical protein
VLPNMCACQPASAAMARKSLRMRLQIPAAVHRWRRLHAVRQFINSAGRSRQDEPVRASQSTASRKRRWSIEGRPALGFCGGSKGKSRFHITSVSRVRIVTPPRCGQISSPLALAT